MSELFQAAPTGLGVGVAYGLLGAAVAVATRATRTLHLAIGPAVVLGALVHLVLLADGRVGTPVAMAAGMLVGALASASLEPLVIGRLREGAARPVGAFVVGAVLATLTARTLGARTVRPQALVEVGGFDLAGTTVPGAAVGALLVGVPVAAGLAWMLGHTRWGARIRIVGGSVAAAEQGGLRPWLVRAGALAIAGAIGTAAALLAAPLTLLGVPQAAGLTLRAVAAALVANNRPLPALGVGIVLGVAEAMGQSLAPAVGADAAVGVVVLVALLTRGGQHAQSWGRAW